MCVCVCKTCIDNLIYKPYDILVHCFIIKCLITIIDSI